MANNQYATAIYIDPREKSVHYYANAAGAEPIHDSRNYKSRGFDREFFTEFIGILQDYMQRYTPAQSANTTIILPDNAVMTDTLSIPAMNRRAMQKSMETTLDGFIKNRKELKIQPFCAVQNKQFSEICISAVREELLSSLRASATSARLMAQNITFAAESTLRGAVALNPKLKSGTFLFLDIKKDFADFIYVLRGEVVAFSTLPFGYSILNPHRISAEDMLFNHAVGELAVLNARERAKSKALTMMGGDGNADVTDVDTENGEEEVTTDASQNGENSGEEEEERDNTPGVQPTVNRTENVIKVLPKKTARKLPKFMQRPQPETEEGYLYENFRIFEKWALCYLAGNERLTRLGTPDAVYVNMPSRYSSLFEDLKAEESENGIPFRSAGIAAQTEWIGEHLEMYGGLFVRRERSLPILRLFRRKNDPHNIF